MNLKSTTRAPDPRPARTRAAIIEAIERLGEQEKEISVSLVVSEAGLSRSSFYSQFNDLGDVAIQLIQQLNETPFTDLVESAQHEGESRPSHITTWALLEEFRKRRGLYTAVLGNSASVAAQREVCDILAQMVLRDLSPHIPDHVDSELSARFIAAGYLANIIEWLSAAHPAPIDQLANGLIAMLPSWATAARGTTRN